MTLITNFETSVAANNPNHATVRSGFEDHPLRLLCFLPPRLIQPHNLWLTPSTKGPGPVAWMLLPSLLVGLLADRADRIRLAREVFSAGVRALRPSLIQGKISHGVQSASGAICCSRLLTVTTSLRQQGRDLWDFLEQAWIVHHRGGVMPSLLLDP